MMVDDILREKAGFHKGYQPQSVSITRLEPSGLLRRLRSVPGKITDYFRRDKIVSVWKSSYCRDARDEYYILVATDGTRFHVEY